jgi:hypothetical protein
VKVREEIIDRSYISGTMSFLERWSQKKALHHRQKKKINKLGEDNENY